MRSSLRLLPPLLLALLSLFSCRGEDEVLVPSTTTTVAKAGRSFYLLNEGNMGSNKASLDYYDGTTGTYRRNLFAEVNPSVVFELGDVGNDLQVYGERLYAVVNVSNLVEVMERRTARHLGQIPIPNCRYIVFHGGYAYVTSYAGPVLLDPTARQGYVAKVDTATLSVVATCTVGYQPEGMAVVGNRLFVANSGGYRAPDYDRRLSVINLDTFTEERQIDVAPNLHQVVYANGRLYVQSRGDYEHTKPDIYVVHPTTLAVEGALGIEASRFCIERGELFALTPSGLRIGNALLSLAHLQTPYGLAVNGDYVYVTDARDYVSPGTVYCYRTDGTLQWQATAGDIPAHFAFTDASLGGASPTPTPPQTFIARILAYRPAPGQFVNELPRYEEGDTEARMCEKVFAAVGEGRTGLVTLGAFGGYIEFALNRAVENRPNAPDFVLYGNAFEGNSEAGTVAVAYDANGNGMPDADEWYELAGSAHAQSDADYEITYTRPAATHTPTPGAIPALTDVTYIPWTDNRGASGFVEQNVYHQQAYYPRWINSPTLTFRSRRLPDNATLSASGRYTLRPFAYGYADNLPNSSAGIQMDIAWAVDRQGNPVALPAIHFVRITTALRQQLGELGETSTEFGGFGVLSSGQ